jgi:hypothetical protein
VVQAADARKCDDFACAWRLDGARDRRIAVERHLGSVLVVEVATRVITRPTFGGSTTRGTHCTAKTSSCTAQRRGSRRRRRRRSAVACRTPLPNSGSLRAPSRSLYFLTISPRALTGEARQRAPARLEATRGRSRRHRREVQALQGTRMRSRRDDGLGHRLRGTNQEARVQGARGRVRDTDYRRGLDAGRAPGARERDAARV